MTRVKLLFVAMLIAAATIPLGATPAQAVICHEHPMGCCGSITVPVINKTYELPINC